jgi:hypothetical protein
MLMISWFLVALHVCLSLPQCHLENIPGSLLVIQSLQQVSRAGVKDEIACRHKSTKCAGVRCQRSQSSIYSNLINAGAGSDLQKGAACRGLKQHRDFGKWTASRHSSCPNNSPTSTVAVSVVENELSRHLGAGHVSLSYKTHVPACSICLIRM